MGDAKRLNHLTDVLAPLLMALLQWFPKTQGIARGTVEWIRRQKHLNRITNNIYEREVDFPLNQINIGPKLSCQYRISRMMCAYVGLPSSPGKTLEYSETR